MKKSKIQAIYDPIFRQNYYFVDCKTHKEFQKICKSELDLNIDDKNYETEGGFYEMTKNNNIICLFWANKQKIEIVVHECFHAITSCLLYKGISLTHSSEEVFSYLLEYLIKEIKIGKSKEK